MFWGLHILLFAVIIEIGKDFFYWKASIFQRQLSIQIQKSFMNLQSHLIVNGSNLSRIFDFVTEKPHFVFQYKREGKFLDRRWKYNKKKEV